MKAALERASWLAFPLGGLSLGIGGLIIDTWLACLGMVLLAAAIASEKARLRALAGVVVFSFVTRAIWLHWGAQMAQTAFSSDLGMIWKVTVGFVVVQTLPVLGLLLLGVAIFGPGAHVRLWLPVAWAAGERLQARWSGIATDWLAFQVDTALVMDLLARAGMWTATILWLFVAASAGAAWIDRRRRVWGPAAIVLGGVLLLPAPSTSGHAALEGVGVLHLTSPIDLPAIDVAAEGLSLLVWPEDALAARPKVKEGSLAGIRLDQPLGGPATSHLAGATTLLLTQQQNSVLAVAPDGEVLASRAKRHLFPVFERRFLGVAREASLREPGAITPLVEIAGRRVVPLICGEMLARVLFAEGVAAGGELVTVSADDWYQTGSEFAWNQVLAHVRLRAVEYGVPVAYASVRGRAALVSADGTVLARSERDAPSGVLSWSATTGPVDRQERGREDVVVLVSEKSVFLRPTCPPGRCRFRTVEEVARALDEGKALPPAETLVVAGHAAPPDYVGQTPEAMARIIAAFAPKLAVLDLCYGASHPLFDALSTRTRALVVASPAFVQARGFHYGSAFWKGGVPEERVRGVTRAPPGPLFTGRLDAKELGAARDALFALDQDALRARVRRWDPTLVGAALAGGEIVFPMDRRRIGRPPSPRERGLTTRP